MTGPLHENHTPHALPEPLHARTLHQMWLLICMLFFCMTLHIFALPAHAQQAATAGVSINQENTVLGLGQRVRPGAWTAVQISLNNPLIQPIRVRIELLVPDADQDLVQYQRVVTLTPQRDEQKTWLYAVAPSGTDLISKWRLQVLDDTTGLLLDYQDITINERYLESRTTVVGIMGQSLMGLEPYSSDATQQEKILFLRGLSPENMPDRWYGLSLLSSIIWTPQVDPADVKITPEFARALREWVRRGGHLVVVLPVVGNRWVDSPLADLLPKARDTVINDVDPLFLGSITNMLDDSTTTSMLISMRVFEPLSGSEAALVAGPEPGSDVSSGSDHKIWGVARRIGRGRVTMLGVDLTDPRIRQMGLPSGGRWTIWSDIFGWHGPAHPPAFVNKEIDEGRMNRPSLREAVYTGDFIAPQIAMRDTAAPSLLLAIALFVLYWVIAGPVQFFGFKQFRMVQHTWLGFVGVVLVFTAVAWGGAWLLRPGHTQVRHFAVLTATRGQNQSHVHAWLSLYVPRHGSVDTQLGHDVSEDKSAYASSQPASEHNAIWSTGFASETQDDAFPDTRRYAINSVSPDRVDFAFRATAKQLELDYLGDLGNLQVVPDEVHLTSTKADAPGIPADKANADARPASNISIDPAKTSWLMPRGPLKIENGGPVGSLTHSLPGSLRHVAVIYCDGSRSDSGRLNEPSYWLYRDPWPPGVALPFAGKPANTQQLIVGADPVWAGRLTDLTRKFKSDSGEVNSEILSFFSMLPPPDYMDVTYKVPILTFGREVGREFDLTPLARMKCLIIMGHLTNAPIPVPLTVDGGHVPSNGDTFVRWIFPLE